MERKQTHVVYGLIAGIGMVILALTLHVTGLTYKMKGISLIAYLPLLVLLIMNANAYSKANNEFVTFGNTFGSCFKATFIAGLIMLVWGIITLFAFPEIKERTIDMMREEWAKNPQMTDQAMDMAISWTRKLWPFTATGGMLLGTLFVGAIFSLIAAAIAPKKPIPMENL